jgi:hypothetical protein
MVPGFGNAFQSCGDIDTVAHQIAVALLDHVAEMDADPELDAPFRRQARISLDHAVLDFDGATYGVDDASELKKDAISRPLYDAAVMQSDGGIKQIAAESPEPRKCPLLVGPSKRAVSGHVRGENGCEFPSLWHDSTLKLE